MTEPIVFFDLDGTLTDPKAGITRCIQFAMEQLDVAPPEADALEWCIGPPLLTSMETLVGKDRAARAVEHYRDRFARVGWLENQPYDGVVAVLQALKRSRTSLYVATSKPAVYARKILEHFELRSYFDDVFGAELNGTNSDKRDLLRRALAETGCPSHSIMIGDRMHDIVGAIANDIEPIGVTYGYGSREELLNAGAKRLIASPAEIVDCLLRAER